MALELVPKRFKKQFEYTTRALVTQLLQLVDDINEVITGIYVRLTSLETPPGFVSVSGAYAITVDDDKKMILVDTTGGAIAISINAALTAIVGARVGVKKLNAQVSNFVTITPDSGTIDGNAAHVLSLANQTVWLESDGTNWFVTDESGTNAYYVSGTTGIQVFADGNCVQRGVFAQDLNATGQTTVNLVLPLVGASYTGAAYVSNGESIIGGGGGYSTLRAIAINSASLGVTTTQLLFRINTPYGSADVRNIRYVVYGRWR